MENYFLILGITGLLNFVAFIWLLIVGFKRSVVWGILIFLFSPLSAIIFAIINWFEAKKAFLAYMLTGVAFLVSLYMFMADYGRDLQEISEAVESGEIAPNEAAQYIGKTEQLPGHAPQQEGMEIENGEVVPADPALQADMPAAETSEMVEPANAPTDAKVADKEMKQDIAEDPKTTETKDAQQAVVEENEPSPYPSLDNVKPDPLVSKKKASEKNTTRVGVNKLNTYLGRYFEVTKKNGTKHRGILVKVSKSQIILERKIYNGTFTYRIRKTDIKRADMFKKEYVDELS